MGNKISWWGAASVFVYLGFVGYLFQYTETCLGMFCDVAIVAAILPWVIFWEDGFQVNLLGVNFNWDGMSWFWALVVVNVLILYFIFAWLQKRFQGR